MTMDPGFLWGAATAAYQVEGAVSEDGRAPSIWDTFSHTPGKIERGETGDVACDHYHRLEEDVDLLADLGVNAYRFSISWPRVIPDGTGAPNIKGLGFYTELVDRLVDKGIAPVPTLYHWDLPQALEAQGGWRNRETAVAFARYAALCAESLGDKVMQWATLNEPWCSAFVGHWHGRHAPGRRNIEEAFVVAHHLLVAHGWAVESMRAVRPHGRYGIVLNSLPYRPAPGVDFKAVGAAIETLDEIGTGMFYGGVMSGEYPKSLLGLSPELAAAIQPNDMTSIAFPLDWLGVNYYSDTLLVPSDEQGFVYPFVTGVSASLPENPTEMGWALTPHGLTDFLVMLHDRFPSLPPLYVTENGAAYDDPATSDGRICDDRRIDYLSTHIDAVAAASAAGVDLGGYFVWSLLDNFEWSYGYRMRFGLIHVDFETLKRTKRDSFFWYRDRIAASG